MACQEQKKSYNLESEGMSKAFISDEIKGSYSLQHGEGLKSEDDYKISEMSKSSIGDKPIAFTSSLLKEGMKFGTGSEFIEETMEENYDKLYKSKSGDETVGAFISTFDGIMTEESDPSHERIMNTATGEVVKPSLSTSAYTCRLFSLAEIISATNNFDDKLVLGRGGFGTVYKGLISSEDASHVVAIKRWDSSSLQGEVEFRAEINTLCNSRHFHLVSLVGYCEDNEEKILVYEYMPNGNLEHHMHNAHSPLSWVIRLKIAIGTARGLDYLHTGVRTRHGVIHRDVKSSNILLDENWVAVISGLGLSILGPTNPSVSYVEDDVKGTFGYLDPEYYFSGKLTWKTDVYSFGVVLFELLSGRRAVEEQHEELGDLVTWAKRCVNERKYDELVDPNIMGTISSRCLKQFAKIADRCLQNALMDRPTMTELVASLQSLLELQEKSDRSTSANKSSSIMDESGTSSQKSPDNKKDQDDDEWSE